MEGDSGGQLGWPEAAGQNLLPVALFRPTKFYACTRPQISAACMHMKASPQNRTLLILKKADRYTVAGLVG